MSYHRTIFLSLLLLCPFAPAMAQDVTEVTLLAYDRKANLLIMKDRTLWQLADLKTPLPDGLASGDRLEIRYESDEDGVSSILGIRILPPKPAQMGAMDITHGTVLAHDRKANMLILRDRTAWSLSELKSPLPDGLKAGTRVEIVYEADEDGIASIDSIRILSE